MWWLIGTTFLLFVAWVIWRVLYVFYRTSENIIDTAISEQLSEPNVTDSDLDNE